MPSDDFPLFNRDGQLLAGRLQDLAREATQRSRTYAQGVPFVDCASGLVIASLAAGGSPGLADSVYFSWRGFGGTAQNDPLTYPTYLGVINGNLQVYGCIDYQLGGWVVDPADNVSVKVPEAGYYLVGGTFGGQLAVPSGWIFSTNGAQDGDYIKASIQTSDGYLNSPLYRLAQHNQRFVGFPGGGNGVTEDAACTSGGLTCDVTFSGVIPARIVHLAANSDIIYRLGLVVNPPNPLLVGPALPGTMQITSGGLGIDVTAVGLHMWAHKLSASTLPPLCPDPAGSVSSGGGGTDCSSGSCGDSGVPGTITATVTAKAGCFTSLPDTLHFTCQNLPPGQHYYSCTTSLAACGCTQADWNIQYLPGGRPQLHVCISGSGGSVPASSGYVCDPFAAVFLVDDGAGNSCTVTAVSP